jgi:hypothetical protein
MSPLHSFLGGVSTFGFLVAALHFLRFWRDSGDRLFAFFAVAFVALAANRVLLSLLAMEERPHPYAYVIRLAAFLVIACAILDKNRR